MRGAGPLEYSVYFEVWRHSSRRWIGRENDQGHAGGGLRPPKSAKIIMLHRLQAWEVTMNTCDIDALDRIARFADGDLIAALKNALVR